MNTHFRLLLVLAALVVPLGCMAQERHAPSRQGSHPTSESRTATVPGGPIAHHAALEIHATWWLGVDSAAAVGDIVQRLGAFADAQGGWVQAASLGETEGSSHVTLRVPPTSLHTLRGLLQHAAGAHGNLREETTSTDVTEALADLDARLRAARATEQRLLALLDQRTGSLADVLAAERALGDERAQIEQLESTQRASQGRVDEATVDVWLELPSAMTAQPLGQSVPQAARAGLGAARDVVMGFALLVLEAGPTLVLLAAMVLLCVWLVRTVRRARA